MSEENYPRHILTIKLWEWESVKEASNFSIAKHGPDQAACYSLETAQLRIDELKEAINVLNPLPNGK